MNFIDVAIAIIFQDGAVLICQRRKGDAFGDLWEFPGGKVEPDETPKACLAREIQEELGMLLWDATPLPKIEHVYPTVAIRLWPFLCQATGQAKPLAAQQLKWIKPTELRDYPFPAANVDLIGQVISKLSSCGE